MRTSKAISTISFNSLQYLITILDQLTKAGKLEFWAVIPHQPEDDEGGKKEHIHVHIVPSKMIQTQQLKDEFVEYDPGNPDKPKGCINFVTSKWDDWYLYGLHDKAYLAQKGQSRRYHYRPDEIISSDQDELNFKVKSIDLLSLSPYMDMIDAQKQGLSYAEYFRRGTVPLPQVLLYERAWQLLLMDKTDRNCRQGHDNDNGPAGKLDQRPEGDLDNN